MIVVAPGAAVVFAAIALTLWWKKKALRLVCALLCAVGICGAGAVVQFLGVGITGITLGGVSVAVVTALVTGIIFWFEVVKKDKLNKVRTPIASFVFGVSLMTASGVGFYTIQEALNRTATRVDQMITTNFDQQAPQAPARK